MSSYNVALNFEDGVTRFVECKAGEKVLDAAFRAKINLPMDCSDGVCGTCKCRAESGSYDMGDDYIEDALSADEKDSGLVLTCQMVPQSDCVIAVPASSTACKTEQSRFAATVTKVETHNDAAVVLELDVVDLGAEADRDAAVAELVDEILDQLLVEELEEARPRLDQGHGDVERAEDRRVFDADHAAAHHGEAARQMRRLDDLVAV